jgi:hypothetical protein
MSCARDNNDPYQRHVLIVGSAGRGLPRSEHAQSAGHKLDKFASSLNRGRNALISRSPRNDRYTDRVLRDRRSKQVFLLVERCAELAEMGPLSPRTLTNVAESSLLQHSAPMQTGAWSGDRIWRAGDGPRP